MSTTPRYMTVEEVAATLRQTPYTVQRKIRAGELPAIKLGRRWLIESAAFTEYLNTEAKTADSTPAAS